MNVNLIAATEADCAAIQTMAVRIWNDHYPPIIGQEQVDFMLERGYNPDSLKQQMEQGQQFYIISVNSSPGGFISVQPKEYGMFINKFYVENTLRGSGTGSSAFNALLLKYPDVLKWKLQVNRQNHKAINFYFKMGFVIEEVADFDIGDGYFMNDFIMVRG